MKEAMTAIVGNRELRQRLARDVLNGTLSHACILEGPSGTGKFLFAETIAASLVCENRENPNLPLPCMQCPSCKKVLERKSPDVIVVEEDDKNKIGVDAIRAIKQDISLVPNDFDRKIYVIRHADKMTEEAQNAFLLTLEEPPSYAHFLLLCENASSLLETVRSRAPILRTETVDRDSVHRYLIEHDRRAKQLLESDPSAFAELLTVSAGGIGRALALLEPSAFAPIRQNRALITELIDSSVRYPQSASHNLPLIFRLAKEREPLKKQLGMISDALRDLILLKKTETVTLLFYSDRNETLALCDQASLPSLYQFLDATEAAKQEIAGNANVRLCLTNLAVRAKLL